MERTDFQDVATGNAGALHDVTAAERGDEPAIKMGERTLTHAELRDRSAAFAGGLAERGIEPDDRLLLYVPNCPEFLIAFFGGLKAGTPVSPANPQYRSRELEHQLTDSNAQVIVTHEQLRDVVEETLEATGADPLVVTVGDARPDDVPFEAVDGDPICVDRADDDISTQLYTSGTTGKPKGVLSTHKNLRTQAFAGLTTGVDEPDDERVLVSLPLYHTTGVYHCTWQPLIKGGCVYLRDPSEWDPADAMAAIEEHEISAFNGVTAMFVDMINDDSFGEYDLSSLESVGEGGAKMSVTVQEEFESVAGVDMYEGYGLTETSGATHAGHDSTFGPRLGTIGQPFRMTDCKIVDESGDEVEPGEEGELLIRGPHVMKGYHNLPEETDAAFDENGYFRTGDIARCDEDNYYEIIDRAKDVIVTAGYNVYPSEVEDLLREHDAIADVAVVGVPDERRNEVPKAFVVPAPNATVGEDITADDVRDFSLDNLAAYKHPRKIEFIDELPRTASGKVRKIELE
ncbi:class I adenylate-forming enzyme family protein [Natronolimnohabitans innermongolicus]|uniref:AMP-dependent synthetase and ligase n=1 Tax=Natronolimnohabitans innermongolicus JCM 12255 TaxID=1227499 RepID=L9WMC3_9EURY|nr:AMP-binding protein [Natronolimnohabitans innermongolicus]ELY50381.1 AMP-dependent synthetase and ligase [Natronolimnohabitans innermongolicus JCM 12255]